jgi:hypothetical protein
MKQRLHLAGWHLAMDVSLSPPRRPCPRHGMPLCFPDRQPFRLPRIMQGNKLAAIEFALFIGFIAWLLFWQRGSSSRKGRKDDEGDD